MNPSRTNETTIGLAKTASPFRESPVNLSSYRYHTGGELRPIDADEPCPVLFRDIGPDAMVEFLRGRLIRLAGPMSPITYMRTAEYREPYTCYERIGRLVFLQPASLYPWHSGMDTIFVANARHSGQRSAIGFVPGDVPLKAAARQLEGVRTLAELREVFGSRSFDEAVTDTCERLIQLNQQREETELWAEPVRRTLQSGNSLLRLELRDAMETVGVSEEDLCAAWHHLPRDRRCGLRDALQAMPAKFFAKAEI